MVGVTVLPRPGVAHWDIASEIREEDVHAGTLPDRFGVSARRAPSEAAGTRRQLGSKDGLGLRAPRSPGEETRGRRVRPVGGWQGTPP
jgi:hypothetical protein